MLRVQPHWGAAEGVIPCPRPNPTHPGNLRRKNVCWLDPSKADTKPALLMHSARNSLNLSRHRKATTLGKARNIQGAARFNCVFPPRFRFVNA